MEEQKPAVFGDPNLDLELHARVRTVLVLLIASSAVVWLTCAPALAQTAPSKTATPATVPPSQSASTVAAQPATSPAVIVENNFRSPPNTPTSTATGSDSGWKTVLDATTAIGAMLLVLATGGLALYTKRLWTSTHGMLTAANSQSAAMERSIVEAGRSATAIASVAESMAANVAMLKQTVGINREIADRQKQTSEIQLRPQVFPTGILSLWTKVEETGLYNWQLRMAWTNFGSTPTKNLTICTTAALRDTILPANFNFPYNEEHFTRGGVLLPHTPQNSALVPWDEQITPDQIEAIQKGEKFLYIWGWAKYKDRLDGQKEYVTRFCWLIGVAGNPRTFVPRSDIPEQRLEFRFSMCQFGNCADDECGSVAPEDLRPAASAVSVADRTPVSVP